MRASETESLFLTLSSFVHVPLSLYCIFQYVSVSFHPLNHIRCWYIFSMHGLCFQISADIREQSSKSSFTPEQSPVSLSALSDCKMHVMQTSAKLRNVSQNSCFPCTTCGTSAGTSSHVVNLTSQITAAHAYCIKFNPKFSITLSGSLHSTSSTLCHLQYSTAQCCVFRVHAGPADCSDQRNHAPSFFSELEEFPDSYYSHSRAIKL